MPTSSVNGEGSSSGGAGGGSGSAGAAGLIIAFDESAMKCWSNGKDVKSGATITKGQELYFQATLPTGKKVKTWKAGTKELGKNQNSIGYKVDPQDADNGKITISYTTDDAQTFTLAFDESAMKCWLNGGAGITTGTTVTEGQRLNFTAALPTGKKVDTWKSSKRNWRGYGNSLFYEVDAQDADGGTITISYTEK